MTPKLLVVLLLAGATGINGQAENIEFFTVTVTHVESRRCLTNVGDVALSLTRCNGGIPQQWDIGPNRGTSLTSPNFISARTTTRCIETERTGDSPVITGCNGPNNQGQEWDRVVVPGRSTWFRLRNTLTNQCLQGSNDGPVMMPCRYDRGQKNFAQQIWEIA